MTKKAAAKAARVTTSLAGPIHGVTSTLADGMSAKSGIVTATITYGTRRPNATTRAKNSAGDDQRSRRRPSLPLVPLRERPASVKLPPMTRAIRVFSLDAVPQGTHYLWSSVVVVEVASFARAVVEYGAEQLRPPRARLPAERTKAPSMHDAVAYDDDHRIDALRQIRHSCDDQRWRRIDHDEVGSGRQLVEQGGQPGEATAESLRTAPPGTTVSERSPQARPGVRRRTRDSTPPGDATRSRRSARRATAPSGGRRSRREGR